MSLSADECQGSSNSQDTTDSVGLNSPGSVCVRVCVCACAIGITQVGSLLKMKSSYVVSLINYPCTLTVCCMYVYMEK